MHDIPFLVDDAKPRRTADDESEAGTGWIACTTDSILAKKDTLWDLLVTMPPPHAAAAKRHAWPKLEAPGGVCVRATQRDLRRYRSLTAGLARLQASPGTSPVTPRTITLQDADGPFLDEAEEKEVVEPLSWTALAYNGFMWWASAGEQARSEQAEEGAHDAELLANLSASRMSMSMDPRSADLSTSIASLTPRRSSTIGHGHSALATAPLDPDEARAELAIIAYFHRLTTQILSTLADLVESVSDDDDDEDDDLAEDSGSDGRNALLNDASEEDRDGRGIRIRSDAVARMGLDVWSAADAAFVKAAIDAYFDRKAYVEGKGVEVCGVKVC